MVLYRIDEDPDWPFNYDFRVDRPYCLPGIRCPVCGKTWGGPGPVYPHLKPAAEHESRFREGWPVSPSEFEALVRLLRPQIPVDLPLSPGADFGPLNGIAFGKLGDFTWPNWTCLISHDALAKLQEATGNLFAVDTGIKLRSGKPFKYSELVVLPRAQMAPQSLPSGAVKRCSGCDRLALHDLKSWDGEFAVANESIPANEHIFRVVDLESHMLVTEKFANAVRDLKLSNVTFKEVPVE